MAKKDNTHKSTNNQSKSNNQNNTAKNHNQHKGNIAKSDNNVAFNKKANDVKAKIDSAVTAMKSGNIKPGAEKFVLKNLEK